MYVYVVFRLLFLESAEHRDMHVRNEIPLFSAVNIDQQTSS